MRIGVIGSRGDAQCQAFQAILAKKGVASVMVESQALDQGIDHAFDGDAFYVNGECLDDVDGWYLRHVSGVMPPAFRQDDQYFLFKDWHRAYLQRRERFGYQLSWLLATSLRGKPILNPPEHGSVVQMKLFQLAAARDVGLATPETLITNNPQRVLDFERQLGGDVVFKPSMGGGLCEPLDAKAKARLNQIVASPVTFQERVRGVSIRATIIGQELVSAVKIPTDALDYRADPNYSGGNQTYEPIELPPDLLAKTRTLLKHCGLLFSGVDFIQKEDGTFVFLEANSSPIYLDIEMKTRTPITEKLVDFLLRLAHEPAWYREVTESARMTESFLSYASPL